MGLFMTVPGYRRVCPVHTPAPEDGDDLSCPLLRGPAAQTDPGRSATLRPGGSGLYGAYI
ncbi:hypothetical protein Mame01_12890 [Microbispora amethystogenes]|nr:hypothetical protein Mame01_12890 [Microbispora amethystogenes]